MKFVFKAIIITFVLTSCSKKFYLDHYSLPCETTGIEAGDLYLLDNNKFFISVRNCGGSLQFPTSSYGTYLKQNDSTFILNSFYKLELSDVVELKSPDSIYRIRMVGKDLSGALNESAKFIINAFDTIRGLSAEVGFRFRSKNETIKTIQIYLPDLNYKTPVYSVKNKSNNKFLFKFNVPWNALTTYPSYVFIDNYIFIKNGNILKGKNRILTRTSVPTFNYAGRQKKRKNKIIPSYMKVGKGVIKYLTEDTTSR